MIASRSAPARPRPCRSTLLPFRALLLCTLGFVSLFVCRTAGAQDAAATGRRDAAAAADDSGGGSAAREDLERAAELEHQ
jgi:hypothetical protein